MIEVIGLVAGIMTVLSLNHFAAGRTVNGCRVQWYSIILWGTYALLLGAWALFILNVILALILLKGRN